MNFDNEDDPLNELLELANDEAAHRPAFYRQLLQSKIFVLGAMDNGEDDDDDSIKTITDGSTVQLHVWTDRDGEKIIPFFSSLDELIKSTHDSAAYLHLPARMFLEMTRGSQTILNPYSDHAKEFFPEEVDILLNGNIPGAVGERMTMQKDTHVTIEQPAEYPSVLVHSLTTYFAGQPAVHSAWLAAITYADDPEQHILIGVVTTSDEFDRISAETGSIAADVAPDDIVDVLFIDRNETEKPKGVAAYLLQETQPFYEARWGLDPHGHDSGHA